MSAPGSRSERMVSWLAERRLLPPWGTPAHHAVFAAYPPQTVSSDGGEIDYLGIRTDPEMLPSFWKSPSPTVLPALPAFDEEYFEWIDVLEAAQAATGRFTMVELGAGYARWAARGWTAAHRRGLEAHVGVVEAEPQHAVWARSHLASNGVPEADITCIEAAVGAEAGETVFLVEMPEGAAGNNARDWYGQAVSWAPMDAAVETGQRYLGHDLVEMPGGWRGIAVPVLSLADVLARFDQIDLADFDIQGAEADAIRAAIGPLTAQVKRLHIGTHSREIDAALPEILAPAGWRCVRSYPCLRWNRTEFGWIKFNDGVQTWVNPRLGG